MQLHHKCSVWRASDSLCRGLQQHDWSGGAFLHLWVGVTWACAYASSESGIDRVKRHHFFVQRLARYGHASSCGSREVRETFLRPRNGEAAILNNAVKQESLG